jgi:hypothetical protein
MSVPKIVTILGTLIKDGNTRNPLIPRRLFRCHFVDPKGSREKGVLIRVNKGYYPWNWRE